MFPTILDSLDNKTRVLPDTKIRGGSLTNCSTMGSVRVDLNFRISYESDIDIVKLVLQEPLTGGDRVPEEPFPLVFIRNIAERNVELAAWPFVPISVYPGFQKVIAELVKQGFDQTGVVIPRPQMEVHLASVQQQ